MLNWSEYEGEEEKPAERCFWREVLFALFVGIALAVILSPMVGCATVTKEASQSPRQEVCLMQLLGHADGGVPVVAATCVTPEEFAASQK